MTNLIEIFKKLPAVGAMYKRLRVKLHLRKKRKQKVQVEKLTLDPTEPLNVGPPKSIARKAFKNSHLNEPV